MESATGGHDRFVFAPGDGSDVIRDFELGKDLIDLTGFAGLTFADLAPVGATDTVIDLGIAGGGAGQTMITVQNIASLTAADFLFA